jgi:hypothetical protein
MNAMYQSNIISGESYHSYENRDSMAYCGQTRLSGGCGGGSCTPFVAQRKSDRQQIVQTVRQLQTTTIGSLPHEKHCRPSNHSNEVLSSRCLALVLRVVCFPLF